MWDTSEYITAAYTLGLPHPPGNPLFVLIGRVFAILPIAKTVAQRINLLAALCSAISAGMWFLITERVLVSWFGERWQRIAVAPSPRSSGRRRSPCGTRASSTRRSTPSRCSASPSSPG
jgi:hypothetical protein